MTKTAMFTALAGPGGDPWSVVAPAGSRVLDVPAKASDRGGLVGQLRALPSGSAVVLLDGRPGSRGRLRAVARTAAITVEHEYIVLPTLRSAAFVLDDAPATVAWLCRSALTVPPGTTLLAAPIDLIVRLMRRFSPWWLLGALAPGRALTGRLP